MASGPRREVSDLLLERYLAGDLSEAQRADVKRMCAASTSLHRRLEALRADRRHFLADEPPAVFARRLVSRLEVPGAPRRWWAWVLGPSAAAAVAAVTVFAVWRLDPPDLRDVAAPAGVEPRAAADEEVEPLPSQPPEPEPSAPPTPAPLRPEAAGAKPRRRAARVGSSRGKAGRAAQRRPPVTKKGQPTKTQKRPSVTKKGQPAKRVLSHERAAGAARDGQKSRRLAVDPPMSGGRPADVADAAPIPAAMGEPEAAPRPVEEGRVPRHVGADQIASGVKAGYPMVARCFQAARREDEVAPGRYVLRLRWTITPEGRARLPRVEGPEEILATSVAECIVKGMRAWRFPEAVEPTPVRGFRLPWEVEEP